jgi:hypothetical protein
MGDQDLFQCLRFDLRQRTAAERGSEGQNSGSEGQNNGCLFYDVSFTFRVPAPIPRQIDS